MATPQGTQVDRQLAEAEQKIVYLLQEIHGTPVFDRARMWVERMTGNRKLSAYIHDDTVPARNRVTVARSLVDILLTKQYDRLPQLDGATGAESAIEPAPGSENQEPKREAAPTDEEPAPDELRAMIRREVRQEFADLLERIARVLRE